MSKCSRCGMEISAATVCPHCGGAPSRSILGRGLKKVANVTGGALETGVKITDKVVKEAKPVVKSVVEVGKKGASKAKQETLKAAKALKEE